MFSVFRYALLIALTTAVTPGRLPGQQGTAPGPFLRVEGGAMNPEDAFNTTLAFGLSTGVGLARGTVGVRVLVQSQNRNSGADLWNDARTLVLLSGEWVGAPRTRFARQRIVRLGVGGMLRAPLRTAPAAVLDVGLRVAIGPHLAMLGTIGAGAAFLPSEDVACGSQGTAVCRVDGSVQPQFNFMVALEVR